MEYYVFIVDEIQNHHSYASAENGLLTAYFDAEDAPITTGNEILSLLWFAVLNYATDRFVLFFHQTNSMLLFR